MNKSEERERNVAQIKLRNRQLLTLPEDKAYALPTTDWYDWMRLHRQLEAEEHLIEVRRNITSR